MNEAPQSGSSTKTGPNHGPLLAQEFPQLPHLLAIHPQNYPRTAAKLA